MRIAFRWQVALFAAVAANLGLAESPKLETARLELRAARYPAAESLLRSVIAEHPASAEPQYLLAYTLFRQGRAAESLSAYTRAAALRRPTSDDLKIVGLNYGLLSAWDDAERWLKRAVAEDPNNLEAEYYLGRVHYTQNRFDEAAATFRRVLKADPQHGKAWNNLGQALEGLNEPAGAETAYREALKLAADATELPALNLGTLLLNRGDLHEALPLLEKAAAIRPESALARFRFGSALVKAGRDAEAEPHLAAAVRLNPRDAAARYVLGRLYSRLGKTELARAEIEASQQLRRQP